MPPLLLCSGGCRSGKSAYAQRWVESMAPRRVYMATALAGDGELRERIRLHQEARGAGWAAVEPLPELWDNPKKSVAAALHNAGAQPGEQAALLFDCLTLWTAAFLDAPLDDAAILARAAQLLDALQALPVPVAVVTNEVGMGLVPEHALSRRFRDLAGLVNQAAASRASTVLFIVSGLPLAVKGAIPL